VTLEAFRLADGVSGLYVDEPEEVYHQTRLGVVSCSGLKALLRSPAHYRAWAEADQAGPTTDAKTFGKALHCAILEPEKFARVYAVLPADAPRRPSITQRNAKNPSDDTLIAIQWWDRWERAGKIALGPDTMQRIRGMQESVLSHPWASLMLKGGASEVVARWIDPETGRECKLRADYFRDGGHPIAFDLKACVDASFKGFGRAVQNYDYHLQDAHYSKGFEVIGKRLEEFVFIAIENEAPFVCQPYFCGIEERACGEMLRARGTRILKKCMDAGRFPGYSDDIEQITLPPWALTDTRGEKHE
jgi:exodeoxyribonuclease VIII